MVELIKSTWGISQHLQVLRLMQGVLAGITDDADYATLLQLLREVTGLSSDAIHLWAQTNDIPPDVLLPNERIMEQGGGDVWRD